MWGLISSVTSELKEAVTSELNVKEGVEHEIDEITSPNNDQILKEQNSNESHSSIKEPDKIISSADTSPDDDKKVNKVLLQKISTLEKKLSMSNSKLTTIEQYYKSKLDHQITATSRLQRKIDLYSSISEKYDVKVEEELKEKEKEKDKLLSIPSQIDNNSKSEESNSNPNPNQFRSTSKSTSSSSSSSLSSPSPSTLSIKYKSLLIDYSTLLQQKQKESQLYINTYNILFTSINNYLINNSNISTDLLTSPLIKDNNIIQSFIDIIKNIKIKIDDYEALNSYCQSKLINVNDDNNNEENKEEKDESNKIELLSNKIIEILEEKNSIETQLNRMKKSVSIEDYNQKIKQKDKVIYNLESNYQKLQKELKDEMNKSEKLENENNENINKIKQLERQIENMNKELTKIQNENEEKEKKIKEFINIKKSSEIIKTKNNEEIEKLKLENDSMNKEIKEMKVNFTKSNELIKENESNQLLIKRNNETIETLKTQISSLLTQNTQSNKEIKELQTKIKTIELESHKQDITNDKKLTNTLKENDSLRLEIQNLKKELNEQKSLKSSDINELNEKFQLKSNELIELKILLSNTMKSNEELKNKLNENEKEKEELVSSNYHYKNMITQIQDQQNIENQPTENETELEYEIEELEKELEEKEESLKQKTTENESLKTTVDELNLFNSKLNEIIHYHQESTVDITYIKHILLNYIRDDKKSEILDVLSSILKLSNDEREEFLKIFKNERVSDVLADLLVNEAVQEI